MVNPRCPIWLVLILPTAMLSACSREKGEAVRFCRVLSRERVVLSNLNLEETTLLAAVKNWAGQLVFFGGGGRQKSNEADQYRIRAEALERKVTEVRERLEAEDLQFAFNQTLRSSLVESLKQREDYLAFVRHSLDVATKDLLSTGLLSVPTNVHRLNRRLGAITPPMTRYSGLSTR